MAWTENVRREYLEKLAACLAEVPSEFLADVVNVLSRVHGAGGKVVVFGNGGSAATAMHMVCDLNKWTISPRARRMRAVSLVSNPALTTALGNDLGYEAIFREQLMNLLDPHDAVVAISCSGQSPNILSAVEWANEAGAATVALTGFGGGRLGELADHALVLTSRDYMPVEDSHMVAAHMIAEALRMHLKAGD